MNGFTKIPNEILFNKDISPEALKIYALLVNLSTRKDFEIKRDYVKSISGFGETAFRRAWKELKVLNLLKVSINRVAGRFTYKFSIAINEESTSEITKTTQIEPEKVEYVILHVEEETSLKNEDKAIKNHILENVINITGFTKEKASKLIKVAKNDINKIINGFNYARAKEGVKDLFKYTLWAIKNNIVLKEKTILKSTKELKFNNFTPRDYDYDLLERRLLGWCDNDNTTSYDLSFNY